MIQCSSPCFLNCASAPMQMFLPYAVSTSCACPPTTRTRSCTRCWSWPSARAARALACSDPTQEEPATNLHLNRESSNLLVKSWWGGKVSLEALQSHELVYVYKNISFSRGTHRLSKKGLRFKLLLLLMLSLADFCVWMLMTLEQRPWVLLYKLKNTKVEAAAYTWCGWDLHHEHFGLKPSGTAVCL